jgi:hypothetical protein
MLRSAIPHSRESSSQHDNASGMCWEGGMYIRCTSIKLLQRRKKMIPKDWLVIKDDITSHDTLEIDVLREDMFQASWGRHVVDCGWYESSSNGVFVAYLISDGDWEHPLLQIQTRTLNDAKWSIRACFSFYLESKTA